MSFDEFLAWDSEDAFAEWVDGEVIIISPASADHQRLRDFLLVLISHFLEFSPIGELFSSPYLMRLRFRPSGREPDLFFVAHEHADRAMATYLDGPADLAVEIVSPDSERRDRVDKYREYETAGIAEYWLLDPIRHEATFFQLGSDQHYHSVPLEDDGFYHSAVLRGFGLRVDWLWQQPRPRVSDILREITG